MDEIDTLQPGERLLLINRFDPKPLYSVLDEQGFETETVRVDEEEWHISIDRRAGTVLFVVPDYCFHIAVIVTSSRSTVPNS